MMSVIVLLVVAAIIQLWVSDSATLPSSISSSKSASSGLLGPGHNLTAPLNNSRPVFSVRDPFDVFIGDKLTIEFYGYQGPVDFNDMDYCVRAANNDIIQKVMADQRETPMGAGPYVWSSGNAALWLSPGEQLTWGKWSLVPAAIKKFMAENELKGTQFILLWHELGPIGYGQLIATSEAHFPETKTTANAFQDPFDREIASIGLTMEFYGYQGFISPFAMRDCISAASNDVVRHLMESQDPMIMEAPSYTYSVDGVHLFLSPMDNLTWNMWAFVPVLIQEFVTENEFKGTQFILLWEGFGPVGFGQLMSTSTSTGAVYKAAKGQSWRMA